MMYCLLWHNFQTPQKPETGLDSLGNLENLELSKLVTVWMTEKSQKILYDCLVMENFGHGAKVSSAFIHQPVKDV